MIPCRAGWVLSAAVAGAVALFPIADAFPATKAVSVRIVPESARRGPGECQQFQAAAFDAKGGRMREGVRFVFRLEGSEEFTVEPGSGLVCPRKGRAPGPGAIVKVIVMETASGQSATAVLTVAAVPTGDPGSQQQMKPTKRELALPTGDPGSQQLKSSAVRQPPSSAGTAGLGGIPKTPEALRRADTRTPAARFAPKNINTAELSMTGMRFAPKNINTAELSMTGWRFVPKTIATGELTMTGMRPVPETPGIIRLRPAPDTVLRPAN